MSELELQREEWIEERAGLREFEAGMGRAEAEAMARRDWDRHCEERASWAPRRPVPTEPERAPRPTPQPVRPTEAGGRA